MKKSIPIILVIALASSSLFGCSSSSDAAASSEPANEMSVVSEHETPASDNAVAETITVENMTAPTEEISEPSAEEQPEDNITEDAVPEDTADDGAEEDNGTDSEEGSSAGSDAAPVKGQPIVWLGDSLTQGSLGDNNDNLPNAPYEKLKAMVGVPVEGYGFYGYNTHDIFWFYRAESQLNQKRDPNKTYIFWVGSNDWVIEGVPNTETAGVISEIDKFVSDGVSIPKYIVIGTTARYELGDSYKVINKALKSHYGKHYLDVADVIGPNGYIEDRIHLKQGSYDAVALAVYNKLIAMGYL